MWACVRVGVEIERILVGEVMNGIQQCSLHYLLFLGSLLVMYAVLEPLSKLATHEVFQVKIHCCY